MEDILSYNLDELSDLMKEWNLPSFRAKQIYKWMYQYRDFSEMSDINKELREN